MGKIEAKKCGSLGETEDPQELFIQCMNKTFKHLVYKTNYGLETIYRVSIPRDFSDTI